jgi:hypothetical protein
MNITYIDTDSQEVIDVVDDPAPIVSQISAERFAASLHATVVRILPTHHENEWNVELKIPNEVRRLHTLLPGNRVRFVAKVGVHEHEGNGVYQYKRCHSYVIVDDGGGEWEVQSMSQMKKL